MSFQDPQSRRLERARQRRLVTRRRRVGAVVSFAVVIGAIVAVAAGVGTGQGEGAVKSKRHEFGTTPGAHRGRRTRRRLLYSAAPGSPGP